MRSVSSSTTGDERTTSQRSSPLARTMLRATSGRGCSPANSLRPGMSSSRSSLPCSSSTKKRAMTEPRSAPISSSGADAPNSAAAASLANTVLPWSSSIVIASARLTSTACRRCCT